MLTARINTVLSLLSSTITTFAVSSLLEKVIRPVDIQNATLAGGVAIGAAANLGVKPFGAMAVGTARAVCSRNKSLDGNTGRFAGDATEVISDLPARDNPRFRLAREAAHLRLAARAGRRDAGRGLLRDDHGRRRCAGRHQPREAWRVNSSI